MNFLDRFSKKSQIKFIKIHPVGTELFHAEGRAGGQTDGPTWRTLQSLFSIFRKRLKSCPSTGLDGPRELQVEAPRIFKQHMKMTRMSAIPTGCLYSRGRSLVLISVAGWVDPRVVRWSEWKNLKDPIGNRAHNLSVCSAVPKPTALQRNQEL